MFAKKRFLYRGSEKVCIHPRARLINFPFSTLSSEIVADADLKRKEKSFAFVEKILVPVAGLPPHLPGFLPPGWPQGLPFGLSAINPALFKTGKREQGLC